jgi:hypothetical protein
VFGTVHHDLSHVSIRPCWFPLSSVDANQPSGTCSQARHDLLRVVAEQVPGARAEGRSDVFRVIETAPAKRQAPAADAAREVTQGPCQSGSVRPGKHDDVVDLAPIRVQRDDLLDPQSSRVEAADRADTGVVGAVARG